MATVVQAESIPRAKKVLKLEVDLGQKRIIVAGIAQNYSPEDLVGKQVIVVANLKPAKLMGILSEGMVLTAEFKDGDTNERLSLATVAAAVEPGTKIA